MVGERPGGGGAIGEGSSREPATAIPLKDRWAAYGAATWAALFAVRAVYWALGGSVGLGTLSSDLQQQAADRQADVVAALWMVAVLLVVGAAWALVLARGRALRLPGAVPLVGGREIPGWMLLLPAAFAGGILLTHGLAYVGLLVTEGFASAEVRWYGLLWGPWFALGGGLFVLAAERFRVRLVLGAVGLAVLLGGVLAGAVAAFGPRLIGGLVQSAPLL